MHNWLGTTARVKRTLIVLADVKAVYHVCPAEDSTTPQLHLKTLLDTHVPQIDQHSVIGTLVTTNTSRR